MQRLRPWTASGRRVPYGSRLPLGNHRQITFLCLGTCVPGILGVTAVVESGKAGEGHLLGALDPESAARRAASGTEGSTPTPSRALAQNGCLRWNAKTFTPADKRASLETEAYFPRGLSGKSSELRFRAHMLQGTGERRGQSGKLSVVLQAVTDTRRTAARCSPRDPGITHRRQGAADNSLCGRYEAVDTPNFKALTEFRAAEVTSGAASARRRLFVGSRKVALTGMLFALI